MTNFAPIPEEVPQTMNEGLSLEYTIHKVIYRNAMSTVLRLEKTELAMAQIVDGLPLFESLTELGDAIHEDHPIRKHTSLCPNAREEYRRYRNEIDVLIGPSFPPSVGFSCS